MEQAGWSAVELARPLGLPLYRPVELVRLALGEEPPHPWRRRARGVVAGTVVHALPRLLGRATFQP